MAQVLNFKNDFEGLTQQNAEEQLKMYGLNIPADAEENPLKISKIVLCPRFFLLIAAAIMMMLGGEILCGCVMLLLTVAYFITEVLKITNCGEQLQLLRRIGGMKFRVVRDGKLTMVRKEYLVPDDIIVLQSGERVPADAHLLEIENLSVDEFALTGDHTPMKKIVGADSKNAVKQSCVYKNTVVVSGSLAARIYATGEDVHSSQNDNVPDLTEFEKAVNRSSPVCNISALCLMALAIVFRFLDAEATVFDLQYVIGILLPAVSFALCFLPAQTSSIVRIYYLSGALKLSRRGATVKDLRVIERMNALTCICVEKSGTITKNHIEVVDEYTDNHRMFSNVSVLSCDIQPTAPIEQAILLNATFRGFDVKELQQNERLMSYAYSDSTKLAGNLWNINGARLLCVKGAPESVMTVCNIDSEKLHFIQKKQHDFAENGNQVIAVAYAALPEDEPVPETLHGLSFVYIGLLAFSNQTKDTIPFAVKSCYKAGVNVIMTTDDSEATAIAIAKKIGLREGRAISGDYLRECSRSGEKPDLTGVNIFSRVNPSQRREIVEMLRQNGEIVAMAGNTINDVEVLSQADVGIAVAQHAAPVANETCDLLMSDENFISIVDAIKDCRQIHANVKRCISLVLSSSIAVAFFALINFVSGGEQGLNAILAAMLSVLVVPVCSLIFLDNSADLKYDFISSGFIGRGVINKTFFPKAIVQGLCLGVAEMLFFFITRGIGMGAFRAGFFFIFNLGTVIAAFTNLSEKRSVLKILREKKGFFGLFISGVLMLVTLMLMYIPYLNSAFGFETLDVPVMLIGILITVVFCGWPELVKFIPKRN